MNNKQIIIKKRLNGKIPYLTEILPEIPTNTILYKRLTGLGATYGELKAQRNSIIIEPNKPVISGKCSDPKHREDNLLGVFEGVYTDDIIEYLEKSTAKKKFFKILTTPESFSKVQEAFEEMEIDIRFNCFLLFDECHKIVKDFNYRADISLPMDCFFQCANKALVSATPIEFTDPRFEQQQFQTITITPEFDHIQELNLYTTNNLLQSVKQVFEQWNDTETPRFIFCNSTDTIYALITQLGLLDESAVFCSDKSVKKLKELKFQNASDTWEPQWMRRYNWLTSRFYNAVDIELDVKPIVCLLTDCYFAEYTTFDPHTDAIQCVGRFRNGVSSIHHIANTNRNFEVRTKEEIKIYVDCQEDIYKQIQTLYNSATKSTYKEAYRDALEVLPFAKFLNPDKTKNYFSIDNYMNDSLVKTYYNNEELLRVTYSQAFNVKTQTMQYPLGDFERLQRTCKGQSIKDKRKVLVAQLELLGDCSTEMEMEHKREILKADSFIVEAYDTIGKAEIERLNYRQKAIRETMILKRYKEDCTGLEVIQLVKNSFEVGKTYKDGFISKELKRIFNKLGITPRKAITSNTIGEYFEFEEVRTAKSREKRLIRCKF